MMLTLMTEAVVMTAAGRRRKRKKISCIISFTIKSRWVLRLSALYLCREANNDMGRR
jgi:hypothetical protein